jgi:VanZ family protein
MLTCAASLEALEERRKRLAERAARQGSGTWFLWYWMPVLAYLAVIYTLGTRQNLHPPFRFPNSDKLWHLAEYLGLGVLLARALRATFRQTRRLTLALAAIAVGVAVGASDEFIQSFVPGRESSLLDLAVDFAAVALAQLGFFSIAKD